MAQTNVVINTPEGSITISPEPVKYPVQGGRARVIAHLPSGRKWEIVSSDKRKRGKPLNGVLQVVAESTPNGGVEYRSARSGRRLSRP